MRWCWIAALCVFPTCTAFRKDAPPPAPTATASTEQSADLSVGGRPWLRTIITPFDPNQAEATYKVYTHIFDFEGKEPITKGMGGLYTHHRGLFIGWKDTLVHGVDYDTWHMTNCTQRHVAWTRQTSKAHEASQTEKIDWCDPDGKPFIHETRTITARPDKDGFRVLDFESVLASAAGTIELKGDLQHAGMQVRLANEVSEHQETTQYVLPEGAKELEDDKVVGAWWTCCSAEVRGMRYWLIHMTPKTFLKEPPVYSIRRYARFGAFFEPTLEEGKPLDLRFRIIVSDKALDRQACAALYQQYIDETS